MKKDIYPYGVETVSDTELRYQVSNSRKAAENEMQTFEEFVESLTPARKALALAVVELYRRSKEAKKEKITCSSDVAGMFGSLAYLDHEQCWAVYVDSSMNVVRKHQIGKGGLTSTAVDIRVIFREAVKCNAVALFLVHNHPSGGLKPSAQDNEVTKKAAEAGQLLNVRLMDHVIIGGKGYFSYADEGRI